MQLQFYLMAWGKVVKVVIYLSAKVVAIDVVGCYFHPQKSTICMPRWNALGNLCELVGAVLLLKTSHHVYNTQYRISYFIISN